jgi:hypothetical protein
VLAFSRTVDDVVARLRQPVIDTGPEVESITVALCVVTERILPKVTPVVLSVTVVAVGITFHTWFRVEVPVVTLATASNVER